MLAVVLLMLVPGLPFAQQLTQSQIDELQRRYPNQRLTQSQIDELQRRYQNRRLTQSQIDELQRRYPNQRPTQSQIDEVQRLYPSPQMTPEQIDALQRPSTPLQLSPQQIDAFKRLSPAQQAAMNEEIAKTGGNLTPEALEALKNRPEFRDLKPEDIVTGKEILEKQEAARKEAEKARLQGSVVGEAEKKALEQKLAEKPVATFEMEKTEAERKTIEGEAKYQSLYERSRQIRKYQDISLDLKPFGYDFFRDASVVLTTDRRDIPVPLKYVVGPGDEVKLSLWGRLNASYTLVVDRDGKITIPNIGPLVVAGMTFEQMSGYLIKQAEQITGTNVDISMGALRTIPIFVLGDVRRPGAYTISAFATITDALLLAGGPTEIGSMRKIELKRKDAVAQTFDLYDLLLKGDKSKDVTLRAGDIVFVPVIGPYVGVAGNIKRPALYEMKDKFSLEHLFELAGGLVPTAYTQQIQVERTVKNEKQIVIDIDDKNLSSVGAFPLQDADLVKVFSIVDKDTNIVTLQGNVKKGGKYALKPGMRLSDILNDPLIDLLPETYFDYALIKRQKPPTMETVLIPFNLGDLLVRRDPAANVELQPLDSIYVFSKWFFKDKPFFSVEGEVRMPGSFDLADNFRVKDGLLAAGDLTRDAHLKQGEIIRLDTNNQYHTLYFDVGRAMADDPAANIPLQDQDRIVIHSVWEEVYKRTVAVEGEVGKPGDYQLTEKMTVKDLIFKAGNILESAYPDDAEISSLSTDNGQEAKLVQRNVNLRKALAGDPDHNLVLKPYDRLFVKRIPDWRPDKYVTLTGEIRFPGRYIIRKGERLSEVIERAGGFRDKAYLRGAIFTRERVRESQQRSILEMADRLERELLADASGQISTALSAEEVAGKKGELEQKKKFVESIRGLKATGRMTIYLAHLRLLKGSPYDLELEQGDQLVIPQKNSVVTVVGAVMTQASLIYSDRMSFQDYISESGGYARFADSDNTFVMKVDGSARKLSRGLLNWSNPRERWELAGFGEPVPAIEPGDTIVVPEKIERIAWLREIRDITQILMNVAVSAAVVIKLW
ncbi:MAG: SLBB domain-containing protein [Deltaproteobacteria bacterium]|nr:SLBB domain-containing protein [Deltaproteobacteria bacterium]